MQIEILVAPKSLPIFYWGFFNTPFQAPAKGDWFVTNMGNFTTSMLEMKLEIVLNPLERLIQNYHVASMSPIYLERFCKWHN